MKISRIMLLGFCGTLMIGCYRQPEYRTTARPATKQSETMAAVRVKSMERQMDNKTLPIYLGRSTTADILSYMDRAADSIRRPSSGNLRYFAYKLADGSELIFALRPAPQGGLVLDHFKAD